MDTTFGSDAAATIDRSSIGFPIGTWSMSIVRNCASILRACSISFRDAMVFFIIRIFLI